MPKKSTIDHRSSVIHEFPDLPSHPDFVSMEQALLKHWYKEGVVKKYLRKNERSKKKFSFLDGPITANNPMGVHHGRGRTYKDLWQRFFTMRGYKQRYQNGFDCQGLWVEVEVEKELGFKSKKDILEYGVEKFVEKCKERVRKFATIQTEQSKRLGMFMDWGHDYYTMSDENNYAIWHFLKVCHERGWIYKGHDSVPWCPRCETAISQHEMLTEDYKEVTHRAIYLELPVIGRTTAVSRVGRQPSSTLENSSPSGLNEAPSRSGASDISGSLNGASVPSKQDHSPSPANSREFLLIWTTTPWTLPANIAVAVDPELEYALVEGTTGDRYWVAKEAVERVFQEGSTSTTSSTGSTGKNHAIIKTARGQELVGLKYRGPFDDLPAVKEVSEGHPDKFHTVVAADPLIMPVTTSEGTGLIHTAVSAGTEDFKLGQKLGLPMIPVISDDAAYMEGFGDLTGKNAKEHPELIFDALKQKETEGEDWIFDIHDYKHRYPACWRCKTELVWKVTEEWYVAMDKPWREQKAKSKKQPQKESSFISWSASTQPKGDPSGFGRSSDFSKKEKSGSSEKTLRDQMIEVAKKINWIPEFGLERELDWLHNMHDWLISKKNRFWGLALPIYECTTCGWFDVIGSKEELKKRAVTGWGKFKGHSPHKPWIDEVKISCPTCKKSVTRIEPVGNPWLDAGIVPFSTLPKEWFPADFITESFPGQFKNWFYSLIVMSTVLAGKHPFKTVLGFESVTGEDGRPMHKSWGNMIEFNEGAEKIGVDVMRWMYAKTPPTSVLPFGYKTGDEIRRRFLLILWNSLRFFVTMARADGWHRIQYSVFSIQYSKNILDKWILSRLEETIRMVTSALNRFDSAPATEALEAFVNDFSTWYIRRSRDRVGPAAHSKIRMQAGKPINDKESAYRTMHEVLVTLAKLLAPFMPYLSDVMYTTLTGEKSVHLSSWPKEGTRAEGRGLKVKEFMKHMNIARDIASAIHAERKRLRIPSRQPLASAVVTMPKARLGQEFVTLIEEETNVKSVTFTEGKLAGIAADLDTILTDALRKEGMAREIIRSIQDLRKKSGTSLSDEIIVHLPDWPREWEEYIKKETFAAELRRAESLRIEPL